MDPEEIAARETLRRLDSVLNDPFDDDLENDPFDDEYLDIEPPTEAEAAAFVVQMGIDVPALHARILARVAEYEAAGGHPTPPAQRDHLVSGARPRARRPGRILAWSVAGAACVAGALVVAWWSADPPPRPRASAIARQRAPNAARPDAGAAPVLDPEPSGAPRR